MQNLKKGQLCDNIYALQSAITIMMHNRPQV